MVSRVERASMFENVEREEPAKPFAGLFGAPPHSDETPMVVKSSLRSDQQADVLLVTRDPELKEKLVKVFSEKNHFSLRVMNSRIIDFEQLLAGVRFPELLILDLDKASIIDTEALERIKKAQFENVPVVVISNYLDQDTVRSLVRIKVDDWLPSDSSALDVYKACERAIRRPIVERPVRDATCYTFYPVSGGCGNTTLAVQAAFLLGKKNKRLEQTCLVDLNFQDGTIADYLDLMPAFKIEELSLAPGRLDRQLLDVMLSRHSSGLAVLATPRMPARYLDISEGMVASILGLLSKSFENVIIDLPKNWYPWTDNVMWGSNKVFIVSAFTVPALRQARFVADAVSGKAPITTDVSVIVNKYQESIFGSGLGRKDAERLLSMRLGGFIPDAGSMVMEAINRGLPISEVSPGSKLEKRLLEIVSVEKERS